MERTVTKSGVNLTYIPVSEVINRLNKVLGVEKWSFTVISCQRDATDNEFVVAHVRLQFIFDDPTYGTHTVTRDGIGGQRIKRTKQGQIVDLGDEFKGAISDALKKAAQTLGVGLYLARSEDAMEVEQAMEVSAQPAQPVSPLLSKVKDLLEALDDERKGQVKAFWAEHSGGQSKPLSKMTDDELELIMSEIVRLKF
jgi:hypothetical protein